MADLHVMMFPFFAFGHIAPFAQLSNKLSSHGFRITFLTIPGFVPKVKTIISSSPKTEIVELEICPSLGLPRDLAGTAELPPSDVGKLMTAVDLTRPRVETLISELKPDLVVFDFAQSWIPSIASKHGVKSMFFNVLSTMAFSFQFATGAQNGGERIPSMEELVKLPKGFPLLSGDENMPLLTPFEAQSLVYAYYPRQDGSPSISVRVPEAINACSGVIIKSCHEMEGPYLDFLKKYIEKPFLLTGPLVPEPPPAGVTLDENFATWLGRFSESSVIFCSFGSETFLTRERIRELALGLELTGLPFILVLNFPKTVDVSAELDGALPLGFLERTKNKGLIHVGWVPQTLILGHVNVGCYVSHAGLSSLIEALVNDCQLVLLPQKLDQAFNARLMGENGVMKTGVEVNTRAEDGYFGKEDICKAVKTVMIDVDQESGKSIRLNQQKWRCFLRNEKIQENFVSNMVVELKKILVGS